MERGNDTFWEFYINYIDTASIDYFNQDDVYFPFSYSWMPGSYWYSKCSFWISFHSPMHDCHDQSNEKPWQMPFCLLLINNLLLCHHWQYWWQMTMKENECNKKEDWYSRQINSQVLRQLFICYKLLTDCSLEDRYESTSVFNFHSIFLLHSLLIILCSLTKQLWNIFCLFVTFGLVFSPVSLAWPADYRDKM